MTGLANGARRRPTNNAIGAKTRPVPINPYVLDPAYKGRLPAIKQQVIEMSLNASGVRDTARVLQISTDTVITILRTEFRRLIQ